MDIYVLIRQWWNFSFDNPELVKPIHSAIYFFSLDHCNRLGWKKKFGFPTEMVKEAIGVKSYNTYINAFNDLVEWGFYELIEKSKNQWSSNIIALSYFDKADVKALDKATMKHVTKQDESTCQSTGESNSSIIIPIYNNTNTQIHKYTNTQESHVEIVNSILTYYSFTEGANFDKFRIASQFVHMLHSDSKLDQFISQFDAYKKFKEQSKQIKHGFKSFIGTIENNFEDGGWCAENWQAKLNDLAPQAEQSVSDNIFETSEKVLQKLKSEIV